MYARSSSGLFRLSHRPRRKMVKAGFILESTGRSIRQKVSLKGGGWPTTCSPTRLPRYRRRNRSSKRRPRQRSALVLPFHFKTAVAFIKIFGRADARELKRLPPGSHGEIFCGFDLVDFRLQ